MNEPSESAERPLEPVGSLADEAARLLTEVEEWARRAGREQAGAASQLVDVLREAGTNLGTQLGHGAECSLCPLCRGLRVVRSTSPEVRDSLATAATSLLQAINAMMATQVRPAGEAPTREAAAKSPAFENIPVTEE